MSAEIFIIIIQGKKVESKDVFWKDHDWFMQ